MPRRHKQTEAHTLVLNRRQRGTRPTSSGDVDEGEAERGRRGRGQRDQYKLQSQSHFSSVQTSGLAADICLLLFTLHPSSRFPTQTSDWKEARETSGPLRASAAAAAGPRGASSREREPCSKAPQQQLQTTEGLKLQQNLFSVSSRQDVHQFGLNQVKPSLTTCFRLLSFQFKVNNKL